VVDTTLKSKFESHQKCVGKKYSRRVQMSLELGSKHFEKLSLLVYANIVNPQSMCEGYSTVADSGFGEGEF
jgi:hypothetical protein